MKYIYKIIFKHNASIQFESDGDIDFSLINDTKPLKIFDENKKELWINLDLEAKSTHYAPATTITMGDLEDDT